MLDDENDAYSSKFVIDNISVIKIFYNGCSNKSRFMGGKQQAEVILFGLV